MEQMIYTAPDDDVDIPRVDVASFVLELADEQATSPALIDGPTGTALTYGELAERVRALAAGLASRGFGHGDVLGVYMPNLPEYAVAFHAAAAAGGMCTTMNPLYTAREAADQLVDSGARMLLTIPAFAETAREAAAAASVEAIIGVGGREGLTPLEELYGDPRDAPAPPLDPPTDLAVLPYSSGTTGLPKGVMLTHRNLVANLCQLQAAFPIGPDDVLIGCLPFFHIYGMTVIMNQGLRAGATIVTTPRLDRPAAAEHRVPPGRSRIRLRRGRGQERRAVAPGAAGDEGLPQQSRGDGGDARSGGLAPQRRRGGSPRGRVLRDRRPPQGAHQVQGLPGRAGGARGADRHPPAGERRRRDRSPRCGSRRAPEGVRGSRGRRAGRGRDHRLGRRPGGAAEARPPRRGDRRDPEVAVGEDPTPRAPRARTRAGCQVAQ